MSWEDRTVKDSFRVDKITVNDIMLHYVQDRFYVNRRYQRKLVWGLREKQLLIDSMMQNIPLPAILLVNYDVPSEGIEDVLEIVDGMQRINAIVSFLLGDFGIEYNGKLCYFDPYSCQETFVLARDGSREMKLHEGSYLPKNLCSDFSRYPLPVIITGKDDATVDLIFRRINSTGRKISSQDMRQSMATGEFADLVRRVASDIRGDNTYSDHVHLCDMPKISIGYQQHGYGVDLNSVFWRRHDLINSEAIKESKDEEIIETLIATVLLGDFKKSKDNLDKLYDNTEKLYMRIEEKVAEFGKDYLEEKFKKTFDTMDMIFNSVDSDFSSYLFAQKRTRNKDECFKILFLAIHQLISEGYTIQNYERVAKRIRDSKTIFTDFTKSNFIDHAAVKVAVENLYALLKQAFCKEIAATGNQMTKEIDKRLGYSRIESQMTEFKIGVSGFKSTTISTDIIRDIAKTLVGMANCSNAKEDGMLIIGIADDKNAYDAWYNVFRESALISNQHYIPGVTKEAEKLYRNTDEYYRALRRCLQNEPISARLKDYILETFEPFDYYGVELIVFHSKYVGEISLYDGVKYVRQASETIVCEGA